MGHYVKAISQRTSLTCLIETFELSNHWKLWFSSRSFPPPPPLSLSLSLSCSPVTIVIHWSMISYLYSLWETFSRFLSNWGGCSFNEHLSTWSFLHSWLPSVEPVPQNSVVDDGPKKLFGSLRFTVYGHVYIFDRYVDFFKFKELECLEGKQLVFFTNLYPTIES